MASLPSWLPLTLIFFISLNLCTHVDYIWIIDSAPSLGVYYFLSLTLSVCLYVCLSRCSFKSILLFCFSMESNHFFGCHLFMWHSTKRCSSIFDLGPLTPKIYSPKFACWSLSQSSSISMSHWDSHSLWVTVFASTTFELDAESSCLPACVNMFVCVGDSVSL